MNAVPSGDHTVGSSGQVMLFADRPEVMNSGRLPAAPANWFNTVGPIPIPVVATSSNHPHRILTPAPGPPPRTDATLGTRRHFPLQTPSRERQEPGIGILAPSASAHALGASVTLSPATICRLTMVMTNALLIRSITASASSLVRADLPAVPHKPRLLLINLTSGQNGHPRTAVRLAIIGTDHSPQD